MSCIMGTNFFILDIFIILCFTISLFQIRFIILTLLASTELGAIQSCLNTAASACFAFQ